MSIQFKGSNLAGVSPAASEIDERELAINTFDKKLYSKTPAGTIIEIGADNINTGMKEVDDGNGPGHRFISEPDINHGSIGNQATDLTVTNTPGNYGALGTQSFSAGLNTTALGVQSIAIGAMSSANNINSTVIGNTLTANGNDSILIGDNSNASGDNVRILGSDSSSNASNTVLIGSDNHTTSSTATNSILIGLGLQSGILDDFVIGRYNIDTSGRIFTVGAGTSDVARANAFEILDNGVVVAPLASTTDINNQPKGLVTVEYISSSSTPGVSSVNAYTGDVILATDDISESGSPTNLWFTLAERNQITLNESNISDLITQKEPTLPNNINAGYFLTNGAGGNDRLWVPNPVTTIKIGDLADVDPISNTIPNNPDAGKILRIDPTGNDAQAQWYELSRLILTEPILPESGMSAGFSFNSDPSNWPPSLDTISQLNDKQNEMLAPLFPTIPVANDAVVITPATPSPVLIANALSGVDDGDPNGYGNRNTTFQMEWVDLGVGFTSDLNTAIKTSTVAAINEVYQATIDNASAIGLNVTNIGNNTTDIGTIGNLAGINSGVSNLVLAVNNVEATISGGGGGLNYITSSAAFTASAGDYSFTDTTAGTFNISLPVGVIGDIIYVTDVASSFAGENAVLVPNGGETIMGVNANFILDVDNSEYKIIYTGSDWRVI